MKIEEIYYELLSECPTIYGSFIVLLAKCDGRYFTENDQQIVNDLKKKYSSVSFSNAYQKWYTKSILLLNALFPERKDEFASLYSPNPKRKELNLLTYTISDAIRGLSNNNVNPSNAIDLIMRQMDIIKSFKDVINSKIRDVRQLIENDVFEDELASAKYLLLKGFNRSAGAICGVLLERHLKNMLASKNLSLSKKDPSINDLNAELYRNGVIDATQNKFLLFLGDIRNKCDHDKKSEPTKDEITDLISGTGKVINTYY